MWFGGPPLFEGHPCVAARLRVARRARASRRHQREGGSILCWDQHKVRGSDLDAVLAAAVEIYEGEVVIHFAHSAGDPGATAVDPTLGPRQHLGEREREGVNIYDLNL